MNQKKNRKKKHEKRNIIQNMMQNISAWMDIQSLLMTVLSAMTIVTTIVMGLLIYSRFKMSVKETNGLLHTVALHQGRKQFRIKEETLGIVFQLMAEITITGRRG